MTTLPNPNTILREAAAPLLTRAAAKMRADAQAAPYRPGRWSVDVSTLADSARLLGPAYDALTATWQQAAYVHAMSPDVGTYLAHVLDNAARDCTTRNPDTALIALALAYLGELDTPAPAAAPDAPALPAVIVTTPAADTEAAPPRVGTPVLEAALRWFYETEQPADAVISHHGLSFPPLTGNRTVRLVPTGREGLPTIFIDVTNVRYARVRGEEVTANPLDPGEINRVVRLLTKLGAQVTATWHGGGGRVSGSISLARPAHPTLLKAVNRYRAGCPEHNRDVFCPCGWKNETAAVKPCLAPIPETFQDGDEAPACGQAGHNSRGNETTCTREPHAPGEDCEDSDGASWPYDG